MDDQILCSHCKINYSSGEYRLCNSCIIAYREEQDALDDIRIINERNELENISASSSNPDDY